MMIPCHRCGDSSFPVSKIAPHVELCGDCIRWIGKGSLMSLTAEYSQWDTRPDGTQLAPIFGTCYQQTVIHTRASKQRDLKRAVKESRRHGFTSVSSLSSRAAR